MREYELAKQYMNESIEYAQQVQLISDNNSTGKTLRSRVRNLFKQDTINVTTTCVTPHPQVKHSQMI